MSSALLLAFGGSELLFWIRGLCGSYLRSFRWGERDLPEDLDFDYHGLYSLGHWKGIKLNRPMKNSLVHCNDNM